MMITVVSAAILLSGGYAFAAAAPRYMRVPGWPNPRRPGPSA